VCGIWDLGSRIRDPPRIWHENENLPVMELEHEVAQQRPS
jgi:hypothetical protein